MSYYQKNKEKLQKSQKIYRENNKEWIAEKKNIYMAEYRKDENHKENQKVFNKKYKEENREKLNEKNKEKVKCQCGCIVNSNGMSKHKRTKKHISLMEKGE